MDGADQVLANVRAGDVDYAAIRRDDVDEALAIIGAVDLSAMRGDARYAFLINAYNLCVLDAVRRRMWRGGRQIRSLRNPLTWLRFFLFTPVRVAGRRMSLFWLEFRYLRRHLRRDPRGHFALVCAAAGCPPLRDGVFHAETLDADLDAAARAFNRPGAGYDLDRHHATLRLSRIYKWYRRDFRATDGVVATWARYARPHDVEWVDGHRPRIRYMRYDWSLNVAS